MDKCINETRRRLAQEAIRRVDNQIDDLQEAIKIHTRTIERLEQIKKRSQKVFDKYSQ